MSVEDFLTHVQSGELIEEWTESDAKDLSRVLASPLLLRVLQHMYQDAEMALLRYAANANFLSDQASAENLLRAQGKLEGVVYVLDKLAELMDEEMANGEEDV